VPDYVQYFNIEKMGRFPNGADALLATRMGVYTKLAGVRNATGGTVYVISAFGKPKKYVLWEVFTVEEVTEEGDQCVASGPGRVLLPPPALSGQAFEQFKTACANFVGFRKIDDQKYAATLKKLAAAAPATLGPACETFCDGLVAAFPKMGDAYYYRGHTRHHLGKPAEARADYERALKLGTNFRDAVSAFLTNSGGTAAAPAPGAKSGMAVRVVAKGVFAAKPPAGTPLGVWQAVLTRRGPDELRQRLLAAYGGKCAVSAADLEAVLEVALIDPDGPAEPKNALLLRADLRTLFDLNLLRIHPRTRKVFLAEPAQTGPYTHLWARQLRAPQTKDHAPDFAALEKRWSAK
jgi:hypothetical protein